MKEALKKERKRGEGEEEEGQKEWVVKRSKGKEGVEQMYLPWGMI